MAIPLSRGEIDFAESQASSLGMMAIDKEIIPPPTADYTPFATKIKDAGANWVFSWAPWVTQVRTFEALRRLGWTGDYLTWAHLEAEGELKRIKDDRLFVIGANSLFDDNLPIQKDIADAAKAAGAKYPPEQMTEGWVAGMVIEAALKGAGWPATAAKIQESMQNLKVDLKGLRGGPIEWTKDNHFRTKQYYRVYRWNGSRIAVVKDWFDYVVKGHDATICARPPRRAHVLQTSASRPRAAHRQHRGPVGDLRPHRLRLRADLPRQPGAQS